MRISPQFRIGFLAIGLLFAAMVSSPAIEAGPKSGGTSPVTDESDLNSDSLIDLADLAIFSSDYLKEDIETVDWCGFYFATRGEARLYKKWPDYYLKRF